MVTDAETRESLDRGKIEGGIEMAKFRVFVLVAVAAGLACGGRKRYWRGSVSCACVQANGGSATTAYLAVDACAADQPDCAPINGRCAELLANAGCTAAPTESACTFDPYWDYCDPYAPG
ncbi:MAG: hypothetical protein LC689_09910 [Myxococcales bacterium]|nr:hypothetical protein [Myxococcales bacterium]